MYKSFFRGIISANIECWFSFGRRRFDFRIHQPAILRFAFVQIFYRELWMSARCLFVCACKHIIFAWTRPYCFSLVIFIGKYLACFTVSLYYSFTFSFSLRFFLYFPAFIWALFAHIVRRMFIICIFFSICSLSCYVNLRRGLPFVSLKRRTTIINHFIFI